MLDDRAAPAFPPLGQAENARAHCRHLRVEIERIDRAEQAAAEGWARRGERAVRIHLKAGGIRGEAGEQRGRHRGPARSRPSVVAPRSRRNLGLIGVDQLGHAPRVRLVAIAFEHRACRDVDHIRAIGEGFRNRAPRRLPGPPSTAAASCTPSLSASLRPSPNSSHDTGCTTPRSSSTNTQTCLYALKRSGNSFFIPARPPAVACGAGLLLIFVFPVLITLMFPLAWISGLTFRRSVIPAKAGSGCSCTYGGNGFPPARE